MNIKYFNRKVTVGLLSLAALCMASAANAETIQLTPSSQSVNMGDTFTLTVHGTDFVNDVSSGSVSLSWDSNFLTLESTLADIATSAAGNGFPLDFGVNSDTPPGSLSATFGTFGTVLGPAFDFFTLTFSPNPAAMPGTGPVSILGGALGDWQDGAGTAITGVGYTNASVTINPVPVPPALWLFGSGLLGMVGVARRRRAPRMA